MACASFIAHLWLGEGGTKPVFATKRPDTMDRDPGGLLSLRGHKDRTNIILSLPSLHQHSLLSAPGDVTFTRVENLDSNTGCTVF